MSARDSYHMYRNGDYTFSLKYCQHSNLTDSVTTLTWEIKPILKQAPVTFTVNKWLAGWEDSSGWNHEKKPHLHKHNRETLSAKLQLHHRVKTGGSEAVELSCIMLRCAVSSTAVHLSCLQCRAHCLLPLACDRGATVWSVWVLR